MISQDPRKYVFVAAVFIKDGKVLTTFRNGTERSNLKHGFIGGRMENGETPRQGTIREIFEEVGLEIEPNNLKLAHTMSLRRPAFHSPKKRRKRLWPTGVMHPARI